MIVNDGNVHVTHDAFDDRDAHLDVAGREANLGISEDSCGHWSLVIMEPLRFVHLNSLSHLHPQKTLEPFFKTLKHELLEMWEPDPEVTRIMNMPWEVPQIPQQSGSWECGYYMLASMDNYILAMARGIRKPNMVCHANFRQSFPVLRKWCMRFQHHFRSHHFLFSHFCHSIFISAPMFLQFAGDWFNFEDCMRIREKLFDAIVVEVSREEDKFKRI